MLSQLGVKEANPKENIMRTITKWFISLGFISCLLGTSPAFANTTSPHIDEAKILVNAPGLSAKALHAAVKGYQWAMARHQVKHANILTVVDFTLPSSRKRLWVIDLANDRILMHIRTAQGKNSGLFYAKHFSNQPGSDKSSLGVYTTLNSYHGKHGLSLRLNGLEPGINSNAYRRAIVVHPAWYVSPQFVAAHGRTGRSWGCFALNPAKSKRFIELTKDGSVLFAYASAEPALPVASNHQLA